MYIICRSIIGHTSYTFYDSLEKMMFSSQLTILIVFNKESYVHPFRFIILKKIRLGIKNLTKKS